MANETVKMPISLLTRLVLSEVAEMQGMKEGELLERLILQEAVRLLQKDTAETPH